MALGAEKQNKQRFPRPKPACNISGETHRNLKAVICAAAAEKKTTGERTWGKTTRPDNDPETNSGTCYYVGSDCRAPEFGTARSNTVHTQKMPATLDKNYRREFRFDTCIRAKSPSNRRATLDPSTVCSILLHYNPHGQTHRCEEVRDHIGRDAKPDIATCWEG